ncbi:hypothetical protein F7725_004955, partial [Dissostichus mawsoni]
RRLRWRGNQQRAKIRTRQKTALATSLRCGRKAEDDQCVTMVNPTASGTASSADSSQIPPMPTAVTMGTPSTQVEHSDADGGFLQEGKQLAEKQPEHTMILSRVAFPMIPTENNAGQHGVDVFEGGVDGARGRQRASFQQQRGVQGLLSFVFVVFQLVVFWFCFLQQGRGFDGGFLEQIWFSVRRVGAMKV